MASPALAARPSDVPAPATVRLDVSRAASVAANFGAITSIYRSVEHNREVGGVVNSYHLQGRAIDVARKPGVTHGMIAAALSRAGYKMIESLDEGDHSHFAFAAAQTAPDRSTPVAAIAAKEEPEKPKYPLVLADQHGVLRVDLTQTETSGGQ